MARDDCKVLIANKNPEGTSRANIAWTGAQKSNACDQFAQLEKQPYQFKPFSDLDQSGPEVDVAKALIRLTLRACGDGCKRRKLSDSCPKK